MMAAFFASGCATTVTVSHPVSEQQAAEVNEELEAREARVTVARSSDASPAVQKDVKIDPMTTRWLERASATPDWQPRSVPTNDLDRVVVRSSGRGALEGFGIGFLVGALGGAAIGGSAKAQEPISSGMLIGIGAGAGGLLGGLVGAAIGASIGHTTTIHFVPAQQEPHTP